VNCTDVRSRVTGGSQPERRRPQSSVIGSLLIAEPQAAGYLDPDSGFFLLTAATAATAVAAVVATALVWHFRGAPYLS